jgi:hypothetical protein
MNKNRRDRGNQVVVPVKREGSSGEVATTFTVRPERMPLMFSPPTTAANTIPAPLNIPVEQLATHHFFANFVAVPHSTNSRGFLDYVIPLVNLERQESHLKMAFSAASMAALANRPNSKSLLVQAEELYAKAIRLVNEALRDPAAQKTDQTLAAVLLLGLFETILSRRGAMTAWGSHIDGAVMIVKMRGKKQLRTKLGSALFIAVRTQMVRFSPLGGRLMLMSADHQLSRNR